MGLKSIIQAMEHHVLLIEFPLMVNEHTNVSHPISDACWWVTTSSSATTIPMINYAQGLLPPSETFDLMYLRSFSATIKLPTKVPVFASTTTNVNTRFCVCVTKLLCALVFHLIMWRDKMWNNIKIQLLMNSHVWDYFDSEFGRSGQGYKVTRFRV